MGGFARLILFLCFIGIISGISFADSSSIATENGRQSVIADFKAGSLSGTTPAAIQFTDVSLGSPDEWYWDFGDGSHETSQNPLHIYTSPGLYSVSLSVTGPAGSDMKTRLGYIKVSETQVTSGLKKSVQTISPKILSLPTSIPTNTPTEPLTPLPTESPVPTPIPASMSDTGTSETHLLDLLTPAILADFSPSVNGGIAPLAVLFTDNSSGNPTSWSWDFGDGTSSDLASPEHVYTLPGKYKVRLTVKGSQGSNTTESKELIEVALMPEASVKAQPKTGSAPLIVAFTDNSSGRINSWLWTFGDGTSSEEQNPVHTYNRAGVYDVSLTISGPDGGANTAIPAMVTVTDLIEPPVAIISTDKTVGEAPLPVRFTDTSTGDVTTRTWDFGDGSSGAESDITHTFTKPGTYTARLTIKGPAGESHVEKVIVVNEPVSVPKAGFSTDVVSGVAPLAVSFMDMSSGSITSYNWIFGDGSSSSETNPIHTYSIAGSYQAILTVSGPGGTSHFEKGIIVSEPAVSPVSSFTTDVSEGVSPLSVSFTDTSSGNINSWKWSFGDGSSSSEKNPVHEYSTAGSYQAELTVSGPGGSSHFEKDIIVSEPAVSPVSSFTTDVSEGVSPLSVSFTDTSSGNINSWKWSFGDGSSSSEKNPVHEYSTAGSYQAELTVSGPGGSSHFEKDIIVSEPAVSPVSSFTTDVSEGVSPLSVSFTDTSSGNISSWKWSFGDGNSSPDKNPVHEYSVAGFYKAELTVSGPGGSSHFEKEIIVTEPAVSPISSFTTDISEGVTPLSVSFTDTSSGNISSWKWSFGDGNSSPDKNPVHEYSVAGFYKAELTVSGPGGSSHFEKEIIVTEPAVSPVSSFTTDVSEGVPPMSVSFTDTSSGNISSWKWSFGDGNSSPDKSPVHVYSVAGSYQAELTVSGPGGSSHFEKEIIVTEPRTPVPTLQITPVPVVISPTPIISGPQEILVTPAPVVMKKPVAKFRTANNEGSAPLTVRFRDTSVGEISSWKWDFGDGTESSDQNPSHTYTKPGNYAASLTITTPEGSQKSDFSLILVTSSTAMPKAVITADLKNGTVPLTVSFIDASTGDINGRSWNFGDGTTSVDVNPVHTYQNPGIYTASLIVKGPAGESRTDEQIVVSLKYEPTPSLVVELPSPALHKSEFDNEVVETHPVELSTITPKVTELQVIPEITPSYNQTLHNPVSESSGILITTDRTVGSAPLKVSFSANSAMRTDRYDWLFGDGSSSHEEHPAHTYEKPGTYDLTLLLDGPDGQGRKVLPAYITVTEPASTKSEPTPVSTPSLQPIPTQNSPPGPTAAISADKMNGTTPLRVSFQAVPTGKIDGYAWDFGDGGTSYEQNPTYIYGTAGNYSVKLVVAGEEGSDEIRLNSSITVLEGMKTPVCGFNAVPVKGYVPLNVSFTDTSSGSISQYEWSLGDGTSSSEKNPSHVYSESGVYTVGLKVSGQAGNSAEIKKDLITVENVPAAPVARFKSDKRSGTAPLEVHFQDLSSGVVSTWNWDLGDGTISNEKDPVMIYNRSGVYAVTETVMGPGGKDVAVRRGYITVSEPQTPPTAVIYAEPVGGSAPLTVKFLDMSTGLVTGWNWDLGDGAISTNKNPTHIYQSEGTYSVNLRVSGPDGENSTTTVIRVSPQEKGIEEPELKSQTVDSYSIEPVSSGTITNESFSNVTVEDQVLSPSGNEKPVAAFSLSGQSGKSPLTITFHDRSSGQITGWQWVFGDGETSDLKEPTHTYQQPGVYTVALAVTGPDGTSQKRIREAVQVF